MNTWNALYEQWCTDPYFDADTRLELTGITDAEEIKDRFYKHLSFGTGGLRGVMGAGTNRMNLYTVRRAAYGLADYAQSLCADGAVVVIAFDTRLHSREFARQMADVFSARGIIVHLFPDPTPTPLLSFATWQLGATLGVMITASHNPKEYNGIKVYDADGVQLVPVKAADALRYILATPVQTPAAQPAPARILPVENAVIEAYLAAVQSQSRDPAGHDRLNIVYTPLHGAGLYPVTEILRRDGFSDVTPVEAQCTPDGRFPTVPVPNPENPQALAQAVLLGAEIGADIVLGTDADSDRLGVSVRHRGEFLRFTGNQIGALLLQYLLETTPQSLLCDAVLLTTVVTGALGTEIAKRHGIRVIETPVGFKYIGEQVVLLHKEGRRFLMAYEESFGFLVGSHARDKDAVVAAMLLCEAAAYWKERGKTLYDALNALYAEYGFVHDALETNTLPGASGAEEILSVMASLRAVGRNIMPDCYKMADYLQDCDSFPAENMLKWYLLSGSWFAARPSGTEPKIKFYFSSCGKNPAQAAQQLASMKEALALYTHDQGGYMQVILLSGGSGKRLWPLSNEARSKQFLKLLSDDNGQPESMLQRVYRQLISVVPDAQVLIATGKSQIDPIRGQLGNSVDVLVEPSRRNTYPAIALSVAYLILRKGLSEDEPVLVMPVDPCTELSYYQTLLSIRQAVDTNMADIVLMGIKPQYPSEKFGYILSESKPVCRDSITAYPVSSFREKPTEAAAAALIENGAVWNGGVFGFRAGYVMRLLRQVCEFSSFEELYAKYDELEKTSFDYAVVEKADSISMIPYSGKWKDLGTWNTLTEEMDCDSIGTVVMAEGSENTTVINETAMPVIVLGAKNMVIAASQDGILVTDKTASSLLKPYAEDFGGRPMYEERRWGEYHVVDYVRYEDDMRSLTKHMYMKAGKSLSYQWHHQRDEVWTIVHGTGELTLDDVVRQVQRGDIIYIKAEQKHGIRAITDLHFIEVQIGMQLQEEDIVRSAQEL